MKRLLITAVALAAALMPLASSQAATTNLSERLKGYFLLSVQDHGKLWYVDPNEGTRLYIPDATAAWVLIKEQMIGISNADLAKLPLPGQRAADPVLRDRLKGRFLLAVEQKGAIWFVNPHTGYRTYLGKGEETYGEIKHVALGITVNDLGQIPMQGRAFTVNDIQNSISHVDYQNAQLGWEFASTLWSGYEAFNRDHGHYPAVTWFENLFGWNQTVFMNDSGFTLDQSEQTYWEWNNFSAQFYQMYFNHFDFTVNTEINEATMTFYLPEQVHTPNYGTLAPGTYYFMTGYGLLNSDQYRNREQLFGSDKSSRIDIDAVKSRFEATADLTSDQAWLFVSSLWQGYEMFSEANEYYVGTQWLENIFEFGLPMYLTADGFSLDRPEAEEEIFWVWSDLSDEFLKFYFEQFLFTVDANGNAVMKFNVNETLQTDDHGVLEPGTYYFTSRWGLITQAEYDKLGDPIFVFSLEGADVNKEAERIVEQVEKIRQALTNFSAYVGGGYPQLKENAIALGENGRTRLTENGGFHPESNTGRVFLDNIRSGAPTTHIIYDSAQGGKSYIITFHLYGSYVRYGKIYTPGIYEATPIGVRKVADLPKA